MGGAAAPNLEPKDDPPASKVELIDLTDDVDSPRRDGSIATEGGRVDDGATTQARVGAAAAAPSTAGETSAATPAPIETPSVDAALADLVKFAKLSAPRGRVPDQNSERVASARRAASRGVRHPTPVSGDARGASSR